MMDDQERIVLLSRLQGFLNYVAWEDLELKNMEPLRAEVDGELNKLLHKEKTG